MSYTALYRKFRPGEFDEVKGQEHIVTTLKNQIKAGRTSHAYLFCGTRGTGKTTVAKILAKAVNCLSPVEGSPCGACAMCQSISAGTSMNVIEIDAASNNGVDNIREIVEEVQYSPTEGKFKVYIIDEVHMLSTGAFNALLKTLEEPPSYVMFILATTEAHKIPITILSRCQRYDFHRITIDTIQARLRELVDREGVDAEDKALNYVAKAADGSMRDALSLLDQCLAFYFHETLTYDRVLEVLGAVDIEVFSGMFRYVITSDVTGAMELLEKMIIAGRDLQQFVIEFIWYMRNLLLVKSSEKGLDMIDVTSEQVKYLREEAEMTDSPVLMRYIRLLSELSNQLRYATQKRVLVEVALIRLCYPQMDADKTIEQLHNRIKVLEDKLEKGVFVQKQGEYPESPANAEKPSAAEPEKKKILAQAINEDIKKIIMDWQLILAQVSPTLGAMLNDVTRTVGENGELLLLFADKVKEEYFIGENGALLTLQNAIEKYISKKVVISTKCVGVQEKDRYEDLGEYLNLVDPNVTFNIE